MSATWLLFHRKRESIRNQDMSQKCQQRSLPPFPERNVMERHRLVYSFQLDVRGQNHPALGLDLVGDQLGEIGGDRPSTVPPRLVSRAWSFGFGVRFEAPMPNQALASEPDTNSRNGNASSGWRSSPQSARSLPALICPIGKTIGGTPALTCKQIGQRGFCANMRPPDACSSTSQSDGHKLHVARAPSA